MKLITYLFLPLPGSHFRFTIPLLILFGLFIVGSVVVKLYLRKKKREKPVLYRLMKRTPNHMRLLGIFGFLLVLARINRAPFLSMRILLFTVLALMLIWAGKTLYCYRITYPHQEAAFRHKTAQQKYRPE